MADQPPGVPAFGQGRHRQARTAQATDGRNRRGDIQGKIRPASPQGHLDRQVTVGAKRFQTQLLEIGTIGRGISVHQGQINLRPGIGGFPPKLLFLRRQNPGHAVRGIERAALGVSVAGQIKRTKRLFLTGDRAIARHALQFEHLKIQGPVPIGHHVEFGKTVRQGDAVQRAGKQINGRGAKELQTTFIDTAFQPGFDRFESDHQIQRVAFAQLGGRLKPAQLEKLEPLRKGEILAQQSVTLETPGGGRQQRLVLAEPHAPDARRRHGAELPGFAPGGLRHQALFRREDLLVNEHRQIIGPANKESQRVEVELRNGGATRALQSNAQGRLGAQLGRQIKLRQIAGEIPRLDNPDGQQPDRVGGAKRAGCGLPFA